MMWLKHYSNELRERKEKKGERLKKWRQWLMK